MPAWPWLPLAALFYVIAALRRLAYRGGWLRAQRLPVPVVVVGNLSVGGSGKTPVVAWLAGELRARGRRPGIVSRGYGGRDHGPRAVGPSDDPAEVGDEPVLLARKTGCPLWIGRDRAAAGRALLAAAPEVDILITDDGLQHYRLARDAELVVIDPLQLGNRWPLPAGPLREPLRRARSATLALLLGPCDTALAAALAGLPCFALKLTPGRWYRLGDPDECCDSAALAGLRLRAVAGIGRPERFFDTLRGLGLTPQCQAFPDHWAYSPADLVLGEAQALLMTEKDAIKCAPFAPAPTWVLPVAAVVAPGALDCLLERVDGSQVA